MEDVKNRTEKKVGLIILKPLCVFIFFVKYTLPLKFQFMLFEFLKTFIILCGFTVSKIFKGNQRPQLYVLPHRIDVSGVHYIESYFHAGKTEYKNQVNCKIKLFHL